MRPEHRPRLAEPPDAAHPGAPYLRRRDLRPVPVAGRRHRRRTTLDLHRAAARLGVVTVMVVSMAAFAVAGRAEPAPPIAPATGPSALQVLSAPSVAPVRPRPCAPSVTTQVSSASASPGTSNHGWGLAVDLCPSAYSGDAGRWLHEVGPAYGWANPAWAHRGGDGPCSPWHWEYTDAVTEIEALTGGR